MALTSESTLNLTSYAAAIKQYYKNIDFTQMVYKKFPVFGMLAKNENWVGSPLVQPITFATVPSASATFATGQALAGSSQQQQFLLTAASDYAFAYLDRQTMLASKTPDGSWVKAATHEIDMAIKEASKRAAFSVFGDGSGVIGTISAASDVTTAVITLADPRQIVNFQVKDTLTCVAPGTSVAGAWSAAVRSGTISVLSVNRRTGQITATGNWNSGVSAVAVGDGITKSGDFNAKPKGFGAWLPLTAPSSGESFFSVDRSSDSRLYGMYADGRGMPFEESLIATAADLAQEGSSPDLAIMNFGNWTNLINALGAKKVYMREGEVRAEGADIGYSSVVIEGPNGPIDIVADPFCPSNVCYVLQKDTWTLHSRDGVPHIFDINGDSGQMLRQASSDSYEVRVGGYYQIGCGAPGWNAVLQLA